MFYLAVIVCIMMNCFVATSKQAFPTKEVCEEASGPITSAYVTMFLQHGLRSVDYICLSPEDMRKFLENRNGTEI